MRVETVRFGAVEVPEDRILRFVSPILGFDNLRHFAVIEDPESAPVLWLQALDAPEVLFAVVDAGLVADDYSVDLDQASVDALELEQAEDARLLCVLTLSPNPAEITVNLRAPVVWNVRRATALQVVLQDTDLDIRRLVYAAGSSRCNKEVARAGTHAPQG